MPNPEMCEVHPDALPADAAVAGDNRNPRRPRRRPAPEQLPADDVELLGLIVQPRPEHDLSKLVLTRSVRREIEAGLHSITMRDELDRVWNLSRLQPQRGRCILNFYGPPGTGKTRAALGAALHLGKPLFQVDYSGVISKYLGDTAKHIRQMFAQARENDAVLFLDEADSLLSKRVSLAESCATSINQNRNTLMQELDRHDGVVIMTTNLFANYDEALLRRIQRHVHFKLPDLAMRERLFALHLPFNGRVEANLPALAAASRGLSGGDILNVCVNAIHAGSIDPDSSKWFVTQAMLLRGVRAAKNAKSEHGDKARRKPRPIGFIPKP